jgi:single-stranded-DNA-specific exonuclease
LSNKILIVQLDDLITDRNLTGLIANQLMSEYQRPVLILNKIENEDGTITWEGSGRGYDKSRLKDFRGFLENNKYVIYAEGHANAFGIGIKDEDISAFIASTNSALDGFDFTPIYNVDFIYKSDELTPDEVIDIAGMKSLWGQGVEEAEIAVEGIKVHKDNIRILSPDKNPTLKIMLPNGINFMKFRSSEEEYDKLYSELGYVTINIVGECERNIWNNKISPQVMIKDYEIVDRANYYF